MTAKKVLLNEVLIMRAVIILLLIIYHSFIIYDGGWTPINNIKQIQAYKWISRISYSFMLPAFVFISGYLFRHQLTYRADEFKPFLIKKLNRLILPSVIFSTLYFLLYRLNNDAFSFKTSIIEILSGSGHLWFLPMLFWCFVIIYFLDKLLKKQKTLIIIILLGISIISFAVPIPFGINNAAHYLFYFYLGYLIYALRIDLIKYSNIRYTLLVLSLYIIAFTVLTILNTEFIGIIEQSRISLIYHAFLLSLKNLNLIIIACFGISLLYLFANCIVVWKSPYKQSNLLIRFNNSTFGIYIFQQFILIFLYYRTNLPTEIGSYWLPIFSSLFTLVISFIFTNFLLKTHVGKALLSA